MKTAEKGWIDTAGASTAVISSWFERVGLFAMACMALTTLVDVIGSKVFQRPLPGSTEITGIIQIVAIAGGMAFSKVAGSQIRVDFIFDLLPQRGKAILDMFGSLLGMAFFAVAGWMSWENTQSLFGSGTKTFLLGIPLYPFAFWIAVCCIPMFFVIFFELLTSAKRVVE